MNKDDIPFTSQCCKLENLMLLTPNNKKYHNEYNNIKIIN